MKDSRSWILVLALATGVAVASDKVDERVAAQLPIYQETLGLNDAQSERVGMALKEKIAVGQEAHAIRQGGDEDRAKAMNQAAAKKFNEALRETLSREQMKTYRAKREEIRGAIKANR